MDKSGEADMLQNTKEMTEARETIQKYIDGANGDLKVLREAYNERALINGRPIEGLFRSVEHYGETHATARIDCIDISGHAGMAKVIVEDWHGQDYAEYLQLLKENGRWTIISKAFDGYADTWIAD